MCGVPLTSLLYPPSNCSETGSEDGGAQEEQDVKRAPKAAVAKASSAGNNGQTKRSRLLPGVLRMHEARRLVRIKMLSCIPGITPKKARAIIDAFPPRAALSDVMKASHQLLASIRVGKADDALLGAELATAVGRVLTNKV